MSSYTKSTNFASKDSLSVGNPLKIVKGTEIDTEFNNISTAIATKADLASPTLTGTPLAPTASAGTNTTQLATTAFVHNEIMAAVYPVGSIYINAGVPTNPGTLLGFGTWVAFGAGKVAVGLDATNALFDALEETGGSADAIVVAHTHTGTTNNGGAATGSISGYGPLGTFYSSSGVFSTSNTQTDGMQGAAGRSGPNTANLSIPDHTHGFTTGSTGASGTNANLQPYITVCMWKRTA
jgi:hypothetical protein